MHNVDTTIVPASNGQTTFAQQPQDLSVLWSANPRSWADMADEIGPAARRYLDPDDPAKWAMPTQMPNENIADYELRCQADDANASIVFLSRVMAGARGATAIKFIQIVQEALWRYSTLMMPHRNRLKGMKPYGPGGTTDMPTRVAFKDMLDDLGMLDGLGVSASATLVTFCLEVLPLFTEYNMPVTDHLSSLVIDESGKVDMKQTVYEAVSAVMYARRNDKIDREFAHMIASYLNDPGHKAMVMHKELNEKLDRLEAPKLQGVAESYRNGPEENEIGIVAHIYFPKGEGFEKFEKRMGKYIELGWCGPLTTDKQEPEVEIVVDVTVDQETGEILEQDDTVGYADDRDPLGSVLGRIE